MAQPDYLYLYYDGWLTKSHRYPEPANPVFFHAASLAPARLPRVESARWRARQELLRVWGRLEALAVQLVGLGGEAHARNESGEWLLYRAERRPEGENPDWVVWFLDRRDPGAQPVHVDLGQQIHDLMQFAANDSGRRRIVTELALEHCIQGVLAPPLVKKDGRVARVAVNGRDYWYRCEALSSSYLQWKRMLWPEDDTITLVCQ